MTTHDFKAFYFGAKSNIAVCLREPQCLRYFKAKQTFAAVPAPPPLPSWSYLKPGQLDPSSSVWRLGHAPRRLH
jgi:hypothetical protein